MRDRLERLMREVRPATWPPLLCAVFALTLLGGWLVGLRPLWLRYGELSASPLELSDVEARAAAGAQVAAALEDELRALRDQLYGSSTELPVEQLESHVIDRLDRLCAERGIQLLGVTPGAPDRMLYFDEFPYDVDVRGRYFALYDWLAAVEHELRPLVVKRFEIEGRAADASVQMELRLVSYRLGPEGA